jgi:dinuclear metal center YbgI/SA1388 family protein
MKLAELVAWLDETLRIREIADFPGACNGLQVENRSGEVVRLAAAVDACEAVIARAAALGANLLLVHHGLLWGGPRPWTGATFRKLRVCVEHDLAIYSAHLPLDVHPEFGNNAVLARLLGMPPARPFLEFNGTPLGLVADWSIPLEELIARVEVVLGHRPHVCPGGPGITRCVAVITGGAGDDVARVAAAGVDTFLTGEGRHPSFTAAEELGVNLLYGGHYATEIFGVRALSDEIARQFSLPWEFIDHPTGL